MSAGSNCITWSVCVFPIYLSATNIDRKIKLPSLVSSHNSNKWLETEAHPQSSSWTNCGSQGKLIFGNSCFTFVSCPTLSWLEQLESLAEHHWISQLSDIYIKDQILRSSRRGWKLALHAPCWYSGAEVSTTWLQWSPSHRPTFTILGNSLVHSLTTSEEHYPCSSGLDIILCLYRRLRTSFYKITWIYHIYMNRVKGNFC